MLCNTRIIPTPDDAAENTMNSFLMFLHQWLLQKEAGSNVTFQIWLDKWTNYWLLLNTCNKTVWAYMIYMGGNTSQKTRTHISRQKRQHSNMHFIFYSPWSSVLCPQVQKRNKPISPSLSNANNSLKIRLARPALMQHIQSLHSVKHQVFWCLSWRRPCCCFLWFPPGQGYHTYFCISLPLEGSCSETLTVHDNDHCPRNLCPDHSYVTSTWQEHCDTEFCKPAKCQSHFPPGLLTEAIRWIIFPYRSLSSALCTGPVCPTELILVITIEKYFWIKRNVGRLHFWHTCSGFCSVLTLWCSHWLTAHRFGLSSFEEKLQSNKESADLSNLFALMVVVFPPFHFLLRFLSMSLCNRWWQ